LTEEVVVDVVMPARNESATVAANVAAAKGCRHVREVIVVDDGSEDDTAERAAAAGARVLRRPGSPGSKAHAMDTGVSASDASHIPSSTPTAPTSPAPTSTRSARPCSTDEPR
jgi:glycosyltransferase involved in cell wall biosynthesis